MRGADARQAMIDAAERLIAEGGMTALNFKAVQELAGQSNKSAAQYHFGSRDGLLEALFEERMSPADERRKEMLAAWRSEGRTLGVRQAVTALIFPLAAETLGRPGSRYARFLVQVWDDPTLTDLLHKHVFAEGTRYLHELLIELAPVADDLARNRAAQVISLTVTSLALWEGRANSPQQTQAWLNDLVEVCIALLTAPGALETSSSCDTEGLIS